LFTPQVVPPHCVVNLYIQDGKRRGGEKNTATNVTKNESSLDFISSKKPSNKQNGALDAIAIAVYM
jgi:hypothetical protein